MPSTILVPTDGSDRAVRRLERAFDLADRENATIHALYVVDTGRYGEPALSSVEVLIDCFEDDGRKHLRTIFAEGERRGVDVEWSCRRGDPTRETVAAARNLSADRVVSCHAGVSARGLRRRGLDDYTVVDTRSYTPADRRRPTP